MAYNESKTREWKSGDTPATGTPALGSYFNDEYDRLYDNFAAIVNNGGSAPPLDMKALYDELGHENVLEIDDADKTVLDTEIYDAYVFVNLTADRNLNLPTLGDNAGRKITVINLGSGYSVNCNPEGSEDINNWNYKFEITEEGGKVEFIALSDRWKATPLNDACILSVESETADTGLALDGTWDDVAGMTLLNGIYGYGYLDARWRQYGEDDSIPQYITLWGGIGKTSGDNAPDVFDEGYVGINSGVADNIQNVKSIWLISNREYESDGSVLYMKSKITTNELNTTSNTAYGDTNEPMYIKWRRIY